MTEAVDPLHLTYILPIQATPFEDVDSYEDCLRPGIPEVADLGTHDVKDFFKGNLDVIPAQMNNGDFRGVVKQDGHFYVLAQVSPACSPVTMPSNLLCESWHISSDIEL
ncbi:hypothetical protein DPMN_151816 [Dreissena polymorpha]|uniref:Uncharacterized protein n=1 Tax=Dreissena polymorpha TaxID=45954 RepID=A0A9D4FH85_DREPO|nr:hypothetical protein DPMN_151816 [Dreissena polymorpha]